MLVSTDVMMPPSELRIGLYVHLDLGWMEHPFPRGSFRISSQQQIDTIRKLGVQQVRVSLDKSDAPASEAPTFAEAAPPAQALQRQPRPAPSDREHAWLNAQKHSLAHCEKQFGLATRAYKQVLDELDTAPQQATLHSTRLIDGMVSELLAQGDSAIRLLSDGVGDRASMHAVNVTVLSLLLGSAMGLDSAGLGELGLAALLHDSGKARLPSQVRLREEHFNASQYKLYQEHVQHSVALGKRMGLPASVLLAVSQHHEMADGSGFPAGHRLEQLTPASRILALVNRYENLCNPPNPVHALTPHEALSLIFSQFKSRFETQTLNAFIRMMGVYPPGSVVQLSDERYALVVSVNAARPLKPLVMVHDPRASSTGAMLLDLEKAPGLGILRSLKAAQLPRQVLDSLSPRKRVCYYFERAVALEEHEGGTAP